MAETKIFMAVDDVYQYSTLTGKDAIRLIHLQPCKGLQGILECSLENTTLAECRDDIGDHYIAISYVWGDANDRRSIFVDGKRLYITASLALALCYVRDSRRVLHVWADGVCINQEDVHDRNRQVRLMGEIYSTAQHTIIFLGKSSPGCDAVLKMMNSEDSSPTKLLTAGQFERVVQREILARPWFTRVWILQELILSRVPWLQCGKSRVRWDVFCKHVIASSSSSWTSHSRLVLENMRESRSKFRVTAESITGQSNEPGLYLAELLSMRRGCGLSDPRDMVYAHLGLAGAAMGNSMAITYDKTVGEVYEAFACLLVKWTSLTDVLSLVEKVQPENRRLSQPSWAPDWTIPHEQSRYVDHYRSDPNPRKEATSFAIPHNLAFYGKNYGCIDTIFPKSFWPEVDFDKVSGLPALTSVPDLVDWLSRTDADFLSIRRLLLNLAVGINSSAGTPWSKVPPIHAFLKSSKKLIRIVSNWTEFTTHKELQPEKVPGGFRMTAMTPEEKTERFALVVLGNLLALTSCYSHGKCVAFFNTKDVIRVSDLANIGDCIIGNSDSGYGKYYIARPCETPLTELQERRLRIDLKMVMKEKGYSEELAKEAWSTPIQTCRFVATAFDAWEGLFPPRHNRDAQEKIFVVR